jgi:hypothetical protein
MRIRMQRSRRRWLVASSTLTTIVTLGAAVAVTRAQSSDSPIPAAATGSQSSASPASGPITVRGCLTRTGGGFSLDVAASTAGSASSGLTSSAAGTSATGAAPSGSVTGQTPTGSTATETATPTPAAGTPGATAAPASPTYNQPTSGTAGTVARPDTPASSAAPAVYSLRPGPGVDLAASVGHTVEVRGRLMPGADQKCCDTEGERQEQQSSSRDADRQQQQSSTRAAGPNAAAASPKAVPSLRVEQVRSIATACRP